MKRANLPIETIGLWALLAVALLVGFLLLKAWMSPGEGIFDPIMSLFPGFE